MILCMQQECWQWPRTFHPSKKSNRTILREKWRNKNLFLLPSMNKKVATGSYLNLILEPILFAMLFFVWSRLMINLNPSFNIYYYHSKTMQNKFMTIQQHMGSTIEKFIWILMYSTCMFVKKTSRVETSQTKK